ncbi:MAG: hypothetical protein COA78_31880 [Blastopirellula sp.]|nr:MAG: hypothetical protein COA78_31880 [Blastopirellula sp.]
MAIDTPATIVILGAGPVAIETALYARFLGYEVRLIERGEIGQSMRQWGHVRMFSPFSMNSSPLGLSALAAQDSERSLPEKDAILTANEFLDQYLVPLATSDLLSGSILTQHEVIAVGRQQLLKREAVGSSQRSETGFEVLVRNHERHEQVIQADIVIDCTGTFDHTNHVGSSGIPAIGEFESRAQIEYRLPDILGNDRERYAAKQTLVIGSGYSAATNVCLLGKLAAESLETHATWITRGETSQDDQAEPSGPMSRIADDLLTERDHLAQQANYLASSDDAHVTHWSKTTIEKIHYDAQGDHFQVTLSGEHAGTHTFDRVIANVGYRPDLSLYRELQVHQCFASEGPMKLAAKLLGESSINCLDQTSHGAESLMTSEPNFYILGSKSYGRSSQFLISVGLDQIRELFSVIGDRAELNLYAPVVLPE